MGWGGQNPTQWTVTPSGLGRRWRKADAPRARGEAYLAGLSRLPDESRRRIKVCCRLILQVIYSAASYRHLRHDHPANDTALAHSADSNRCQQEYGFILEGRLRCYGAPTLAVGVSPEDLMMTECAQLHTESESCSTETVYYDTIFPVGADHLHHITKQCCISDIIVLLCRGNCAGQN